jgi:hypothetical protein
LFLELDESDLERRQLRVLGLHLRLEGLQLRLQLLTIRTIG